MSPPEPKKIFLSDLTFDAAESEAVANVLRSKWLTMGPRVEQFEQAIAKYSGAQHAIALSSCTAGLFLLLEALGIGPGDEVLLPSLTFVATANVVVKLGATPVFCDIVSESLPIIDPAEVKAKISDRTRAVFSMDYAGYPCDYDALAHTIGLRGANRPVLLEDAAHGIGGFYREGRAIGNCARAGVYSFFSNKNLVTGEGGMVVTDDADLAAQVRSARGHGVTTTTWERHEGRAGSYDVQQPGWNFRPTEITAALGLAQFAKLEANQSARDRCVAHYAQQLAEIAEVTVPFVSHSPDQPPDQPNGFRPANHIFAILLEDSSQRDLVRQHLTSQGIQTSHHYPPVHKLSYYAAQNENVKLPKTENFSARQLTLPLHPGLRDDDIDIITREIKKGLSA